MRARGQMEETYNPSISTPNDRREGERGMWVGKECDKVSEKWRGKQKTRGWNGQSSCWNVTMQKKKITTTAAKAMITPEKLHAYLDSNTVPIFPSYFCSFSVHRLPSPVLSRADVWWFCNVAETPKRSPQTNGPCSDDHIFRLAVD